METPVLTTLLTSSGVIIVSLLTGIFMLRGKRVDHKAAKEDKKDSLKSDLRVMFDDGLSHRIASHLMAGYITSEALRSLEKVYDVCKSRYGMNGDFDRRMVKVRAMPDSPPGAVRAPTESKPFILAVDDDPLALDIIRITLRGMYELKVIKSTSEVAPYLKDNRVDFIILDYRIDELTGLDLIPAIRETHKDVPIAMITSEESSDVIGEAIKLGVSEFLTKPFIASELRKAVERHI